MNSSLFLGLTDGRERPTSPPAKFNREVFLSEEERAAGVHVIGSPGSGKSKFLEHCIRQDIDEGRGVCVIDPKGELYYDILRYCASIRHGRQIIPLNLSNSQHVIGFNPFTAGQGDAHTLVNRAIAALVKAWGLRNTDETPTLESILRCVFHAIIEGGFTIAEAEHFLSYDDRTIRDYLASHITNPAVLAEWRQVSAGSRHDWREEWRSTRSKLLRFLSARPLLRNMAVADGLDIRRIMDEGHVLLVNLQESEGSLDEMDARVFGSMLVSKFFSTARSRIRPDGTSPRPFYLYCDEFQNFISPDVPNILAQGRAMGLSLILAHQYLGQLESEDSRLMDAVLAAVRTRVVFGLESYEDAARIVPSLFRGLLDFHEVKRIDYSLKFWQQYDRETTIAVSDGDTSGAGVALGSHKDWSDNYSSGTSHPSLPFPNGQGMSFENFGGTNSGGNSRVDSSFNATSRARTVSDGPFYRQIPILEGKETPWSLEEQKHRLADALLLQLQRYCWVKKRDQLAVPVLVPKVQLYDLSTSLITSFEVENAAKSGAISAEEADAVLHDRARSIAVQAQMYFDQLERENVESRRYDEQSAKPRPKREPTEIPKPIRKKKPPSETPASE